ncbi:MAG: hypothetical protein HUJ56_09625, partial [Erysipelotrichaceae bacterium]|nr:hypothetical protein [Erysipelotrichaceae bacterium]
MKYDKFFEACKAKGISEAEINFSTASATSISLFHGEIDKYESSDSASYTIRGMYKGKMGSIHADTFDNKLVEFYVDEIINNAKYINNDDPAFIYKGSEKYHKVNPYNKELNKIPFEDKIKKLHELETKIKNGDKNIAEVSEVGYEESESSNTIVNSHGLKLSQKNNHFVMYGVAVAKKGEQTKTGFDLV